LPTDLSGDFKRISKPSDDQYRPNMVEIVFSENYQEISFRASNIATTLSTGTLA
jgi:hypothetical protein